MTIVRVQLTHHHLGGGHGSLGSAQYQAVAQLVDQQIQLPAVGAGVETFLDQPGHVLGVGRIQSNNLGDLLATGIALGRTEHPHQALNPAHFLLRAADDDTVILGIGKNGRCVGLPRWVVAQLILIQLADRLHDLVRLAKRNFNEFELVRPEVLTTLVKIPGKDFDLLKLGLRANDNQARTVLVSKDLRTRSVRRNLIVEQPLG